MRKNKRFTITANIDSIDFNHLYVFGVSVLGALKADVQLSAENNLGRKKTLPNVENILELI